MKFSPVERVDQLTVAGQVPCTSRGWHQTDLGRTTFYWWRAETAWDSEIPADPTWPTTECRVADPHQGCREWEAVIGHDMTANDRTNQDHLYRYTHRICIHKAVKQFNVRQYDSSYDHAVFTGDSSMTVVSSRLTTAQNSKGNIGSGDAEWERGRNICNFRPISRQNSLIGSHLPTW